MEKEKLEPTIEDMKNLLNYAKQSNDLCDTLSYAFNYGAEQVKNKSNQK